MTALFAAKPRLRTICLVFSIFCVVLPIVPSAFAQSRQQHIHHMAGTVMPFAISKALHVFAMTETGGVLRVVAKNPEEADQIALIQQHLRFEAINFQNGDYGDPAKLHGKDMPGLKELAAAGSALQVAYQDVPSGGEITFTTTDLHLLTALHRWFGAQLSDHCRDATAQ